MKPLNKTLYMFVIFSALILIFSVSVSAESLTYSGLPWENSGILIKNNDVFTGEYPFGGRVSLEKEVHASSYCLASGDNKNGRMTLGFVSGASSQNSGIKLLYSLPDALKKEGIVATYSFTLRALTPSSTYAYFAVDGGRVHQFNYVSTPVLQVSGNRVKIVFDTTGASLTSGNCVIIKGYLDDKEIFSKEYASFPQNAGIIIAAYNTKTVYIENMEFEAQADFANIFKNGYISPVRFDKSNFAASCEVVTPKSGGKTHLFLAGYDEEGNLSDLKAESTMQNAGAQCIKTSFEGDVSYSKISAVAFTNNMKASGGGVLHIPDGEESFQLFNEYNFGVTPLSLTKIPGEGTFSQKNENKKTIFSYKSTSDKSGGYFDIPTGDIKEGCNDFVLDLAFRINSVTGSSRLHLLDIRTNSGFVTTNALDIGSALSVIEKSSNMNIATLKKGKWHRISYAFHKSENTADIFIDGIKVFTQSYQGSIKPVLYRMELISPAGSEIDVDFDWIRLYEGKDVMGAKEIKNCNETAKSGAEDTIMDSPEKLNAILKNTQIFMVANNTKYVDGEKIYLGENDEKAKISGSVFYITKSDIEDICGEKVSYNTNTKELKIGNRAVLTVGRTDCKINGRYAKISMAPIVQGDTVYVPIKVIAEELLGKKVNIDPRGFAVVSEKGFDAVSEFKYLDRYIQWYSLDLIWRYMFYDNPTGKQVIETVKKIHPSNGHPRVVYSKEDIQYIRNKNKNDEEWKRVCAATVADGNTALKTNIESFRTANDTVARNAGNALIMLSKAYAITGDNKYAEHGVKIMQALSTWQSGTVSSVNYNFAWGFLSAGLSWGIDSFYNYMQSSESGRAAFKEIKDGIIKNVIFYDFIENYKGKSSSLYALRIQDNFVGLFAGGMTMLCLTLCDEDDLYQECEYLIPNVLKTFGVAADIMLPDGGYSESVSYGGLHLTYVGEALAALWNCCGEDYNIGMNPGLLKSGAAFSKLQSVNHSAGYHDGGGFTNYTEDPIRCLQAYRYGNVKDAQMFRNRNENVKRDFTLNNLLWYCRAIDNLGYVPDVTHEEKDYWSRSAGTGSFINDRKTLTPVFATYHGGWTGITHDSLDLGSFIFESDNFLWATDLGQDEYSVGNYWALEGYNIYRKNPQGENCLVINPTKYKSGYYGQTIGVYADRIKQMSKAKGAYAVLDLSGAYSSDVSEYKRGYYFGDNRNTYLIQDELTLKTADAELYWFMQTPAKVEILSNSKARLTTPDGKKTLTLDVYCSVDGYKLQVGAAKPLDGTPSVAGQNPNNGISRVAVHIPKANGDVKIAVKLSPSSMLAPYTGITYTPINQWTIPDGDYK